MRISTYNSAPFTKRLPESHASKSHPVDVATIGAGLVVGAFATAYGAVPIMGAAGHLKYLDGDHPALAALGLVANLGSLSYLGDPTKMLGGAAAGWAMAGISGLALAYNFLSDNDPFSS